MTNRRIMSSLLPFHHHHRRTPPPITVLPSELPVSVLIDLGHEQAENGNYKDARISFQYAVIQLQNSTNNTAMSSSGATAASSPPHQHYKNTTAKKTIDGYELAAALSDLGHCCFELQLLNEAETYWQESLRLKRRYYNHASTETGGAECCNKNLDLAYSLENVGKVLQSQGQYNAAKRHYNEALDMKRLVYGKQQQHGHSSQGETVLVQRRKIGNGNNHLKQQKYGYDRAQNTDVACTLTTLGDLAHACQQFHKARKLYTEAIEMYRHCHGVSKCSRDLETVEHVDIALVLSKLGQVHAETGHRRYAASYFDQAEEMAENIGDDNLLATIQQQRAAAFEKLQPLPTPSTPPPPPQQQVSE